jgi:hypothetical protein
MTSRPFGNLAPVLLILAAASGTLVYTQVTHASDAGVLTTSVEQDQRIVKCDLYDSTPLEDNVTMDLYSGDVERDFDSSSQRDAWIRNNCNLEPNLQELGTAYGPFSSDQTYDKPPGRLTTKLNNYQIRRASLGGYYPNDSYGDGPLVIEANRVRIIGIENATRVHDGGDQSPQTLIPETGKLYGYFNVSTGPERYLYDTVPYRDTVDHPNITEYEIQLKGGIMDSDFVRYNTSCVVVNGGSCGGPNDVTTGRFYIGGCDFNPWDNCRRGKLGHRYNLSGVENVENISIRVKVEMKFTELRWECFYDEDSPRDWCYTDNGTRKDGFRLWTVEESRRFTRSTWLTHTINVTPNRPNATLEVAKFPDGSYEARIQTEGVRHLTVGRTDDGRTMGLRYQWRYFSRSTRYYNQLDHQPVWLHAYPARTYRSIPAFGGPTTIERSFGETSDFSTGDLPPNVTVDEAAGEFTPIDELVVKNIDQFSKDNVTARGIAPGTTAEIDITTRKVVRSNLTVTKIGGNDTHSKFRLELTESDGDPIYTGNRPGYITINRQTVETDQNGVAIVTTRNVGPVRAEFEPAEWYRLDPEYTAYTTSTGRGYTGPGRGLLDLLVFIIRRTAVVWVPLLIALYMIDKLPDADTWPPWKVLQ